MTFHTFRHTRASMAANAGTDERELQRLGNWKTVLMARRYIHLSDKRQRAAEQKLAEVLSLTAQGNDEILHSRLGRHEQGYVSKRVVYVLEWKSWCRSRDSNSDGLAARWDFKPNQKRPPVSSE